MAWSKDWQRDREKIRLAGNGTETTPRQAWSPVMRWSFVDRGVAGAAAPAAGAAGIDDPVRALLAILPRPVRFLGVGGLGLIVDLAVLTLLIAHGLNPLAARAASLAVATTVTWRLNRALTFAGSGRRPADEAMRYALVAAIAQTVSYGIFAAVVLALPNVMPQLAAIAGAAAGASISYCGQAFFAFQPLRRT